MAEMSSLLSSLDIQPRVRCCTLAVLLNKGLLPNEHRSQYMALAFEQKKKAFIVRSTGKETGGKAQICLPGPGFGARFQGL